MNLEELLSLALRSRKIVCYFHYLQLSAPCNYVLLVKCNKSLFLFKEKPVGIVTPAS